MRFGLEMRSHDGLFSKTFSARLAIKHVCIYCVLHICFIFVADCPSNLQGYPITKNKEYKILPYRLDIVDALERESLLNTAIALAHTRYTHAVFA
jgi:hypothetical protein